MFFFHLVVLKFRLTKINWLGLWAGLHNTSNLLGILIWSTFLAVNILKVYFSCKVQLLRFLFLELFLFSFRSRHSWNFHHLCDCMLQTVQIIFPFILFCCLWLDLTLTVLFYINKHYSWTRPHMSSICLLCQLHWSLDSHVWIYTYVSWLCNF